MDADNASVTSAATRFLARRVGAAAGVWWGVVTATFLILHLVPGGTAQPFLSLRFSGADALALERQLGLTAPWWQQYLRWWWAVLHANLGTDWVTDLPVVQLLAQALPNTLLLMGSALALTIAGGLGLAAWAVLRPRSCWARAVLAFSRLGPAFPDFWIGSLLLWAAARWLPALPAGGTGIGEGGLIAVPLHLALPVATLVLAQTPFWTRLWFVRLSETMRAPYVLAAQARGLNARQLLWGEALPAAWPPLLALLGAQAVPALVSGAVVVESIFDWPGMGRLVWQAAEAHDLPLVLGAVLTTAAVTVCSALLTDLWVLLRDPRLLRPWQREAS